MQIQDHLYQKNMYQSLWGENPEKMKDEKWTILDRQAFEVI